MTASRKWNRIPVPGFEGLYEVDEMGSIYALVDRNGYIRKRPYKLKTYFANEVNLVELYKERKGHKTTVARVVCSAFHGQRSSRYYSANHINGDKTDNRAVNLEWIVRQGPSIIENGIRKSPITKELYEKTRWNQNPDINKHTKLTAEKVKEINAIFQREDHPSLREMAIRYGVTSSHMANIKAGRVWKNITDS